MSRTSRSHGSTQSLGQPTIVPASKCSRISASRILFLSCLGASAAILGYFAHRIISSSEYDLAKLQYEAIADRFLDTAEEITLRKTRAAQTLASIFQNRFPNASSWPYVLLEGYEEIATNLIAVSDGRGMGFCPLVEPGEEAVQFEAFAFDYLDRKFGSNHSLGNAAGGRGIHGTDLVNGTEVRFLDRDGRPWNAELGTYDGAASPHRYLAPMLQHNQGANSAIVMRNIRNDRGRGADIDRMMECLANLQPGEDRPCGEISDLIPGPDGAPSSYIYEPIRHGNKMTGLISSSIRWNDTFTEIFTDRVSGLSLVISTGHDDTYTYSVDNGKVTFVGAGNHHDPKYDDYKMSAALTGEALNDESYTLAVYPTESTFTSTTTSNPSVAAFGAVFIIIFTSVLFVLYDAIVSSNIKEKGSLLDAKREFMRYVSHEVRTPLNTVCMGMTLLQADIRNAIGPTKNENGQVDPSFMNTSISRRCDMHTDESTGYSTCTCTTLSTSQQEQQQSAQTSALQLADEIIAAANSAVGVLNDFLHYDKINSKSLCLDLSVLNIWHDVEQALLGFKLPADVKNIDLKVDFSLLATEDPGHQGMPATISDLSLTILEKRVIGDDARISQIFRNIISNSLKFTPKGGRVTIQAKWIPPATTQVTFAGKYHGARKDTTTTLALADGKQVVASPCGQAQISVKDTGAGMTREQLDRVFAAGVQFNVNVLQQGQGSGLGMYIAKEIATQHGGSLVADSEGIGKGSTFTLTLPLYDIPDDALPEGLGRLQVRPHTTIPSTADDPKMFVSNRVFEPLQILVVDDAATNRKLLRRLLERMGHICDEAVDGAEAVIKALGEGVDQKEEHEPYFDTILLDYEMPVMNGPDAVKKLRDGGCDSFVVGITGNVLPEDISHFKACGANEVLHKPVDLDALGALWMEYGITGSGGGNAKTDP